MSAALANGARYFSGRSINRNEITPCP
jgi:hypothetical protein